MTSSNSNTAAININPNAASPSHMNHDMTMAGSSVGTDAAYSPPSGSYSPPAFTYTTAEGATSETMTGMGDMPGLAGSSSGGQHDRRYNASKVPPSRFQKRKGSIYSTPGSRDGHVDNNYAAKFHAKHAELGYNKSK
ncbi:hypothetical protein SEUCBS139899_000825 [Sporothrix eucalyptigena]|uniref:C6 zinc finger domain containing protein n=1 Tax=Sporothrix eucalyptigena TaxID=1812306 RepID=A0ABP0AVJ4_9PEZI